MYVFPLIIIVSRHSFLFSVKALRRKLKISLHHLGRNLIIYLDEALIVLMHKLGGFSVKYSENNKLLFPICVESRHGIDLSSTYTFFT